MSDHPTDNVLPLASSIVAAFAGRNQIGPSELPGIIRSVHAALRGLVNGEVEAEAEPVALVPAVPINAAVSKDAIVCLECGKGFRTLKRHLSAEHDLSPADYKARWQLSKDYPLVAPSYSRQRAKLAKTLGLGRKLKGD